MSAVATRGDTRARRERIHELVWEVLAVEMRVSGVSRAYRAKRLADVLGLAEHADESRHGATLAAQYRALS